MNDILGLLEKEPEISTINQGIGLNEGYQKSLAEDEVVEAPADTDERKECE